VLPHFFSVLKACPSTFWSTPMPLIITVWYALTWSLQTRVPCLFCVIVFRLRTHWFSIEDRPSSLYFDFDIYVRFLGDIPKYRLKCIPILQIMKGKNTTDWISHFWPQFIDKWQKDHTHIINFLRHINIYYQMECKWDIQSVVLGYVISPNQGTMPVLCDSISTSYTLI
jgi:hypothetical protein